MEQTPEKSEPPPSYRETYRRHRKLFCLPVILGAVAGAFFLFSSAGSYKSTASIWVDTAPPLASTVGAELTTPLNTPPAAAEQGILTELLTTQSFATSVAKSALIAKSLGGPASIDKQVTETVAGEQLLKISYSGPSPAVAQSVLNAIVTQLRDYNNGLTAQHNQQAEAYDTEQVKLDEAALSTARTNANAYLAQHPGASQSDPNVLALTAAENNALTQLGQANSALSQATATHNAGGWSMEVVDAASPGVAPALGKKKIVEVILGGAFGGLLLSFLVVVALTPAKKEVWEDELPLGTPLAPNGATDTFRGQGSVPTAAGNGQSDLPTAVGQDGPGLSTSERRFVFIRPSKQTDD